MRAHLVLEVVRLDSILGSGRLELLTVLVLANTADVSGGARSLGQPLRNADAILCGPARNVLHLEVRHQVLQYGRPNEQHSRIDWSATIDTHLINLQLLVSSTVCRASEHGIVGLDPVLGEHLGRHNGGDVEEWVALRSHTANAVSAPQAKRKKKSRTMPRRDIAVCV